MKIHIAIDIKTNRLVRNFILVDLMLLAGWGLVGPVFSIYVIEGVRGATLVTVGVGAAVYWILKSILQIPIAQYLDRKPGEKDDFRTLVGGLLIAGVAAFSFGFVTEVWQLYLVQALQAVGFALYAASWPAIFSRHLDKDKVSFDWALDSTAAGLAAGVSGFLGSVIANQLGFPSVFLFAAILSFISAFILIMAPEVILPKRESASAAMRDHTPANIGR